MNSADIPALSTAIAALIVAVAQLVTALDSHKTVKASSVKLDTIQTNTNGALESAHAMIAALQSTKATASEVAARGVSESVPERGVYHPLPPKESA